MDGIWISLLGAWGIQAASLLSPGPGVLFLLSAASTHGRSHALAGAIGIAGAAVVWSTATVLGLSALLAEASGALFVMKVVGSGYLAWLAWKSFRSAVRPNNPLTPQHSRQKTLLSSVVAGFTMQVSNPKAIFFWLAIASLGATADGPSWVAPVFIVVSVLISLSIHAGWAILFSTSTTLSFYGRVKRRIDTILGALFFFFFGCRISLSD